MMGNYSAYSLFKRIGLVLLLLFWGFVPLAMGGESSVIAPLATRSLLLDLQAVDNALIAVGERGHILISEDGGSSWNQARVPTRATLTAVHFIDRNRGWVVGHDQVILRTEDGGQSWELVHQNIEEQSPLLDVYFLDAEHGYAVGAYGQFLETFDAGSSWENRWISEDDFHLNKISAVGENKLFIAAEAGYVYVSDDGGKNWNAVPPDYEGSFFGILPLAQNSLLVYGLRGNLFRSDDGGDSWEQIPTPTQSSLTDGVRLDDGTLVLAGLAGALLSSRDEGRSFELHQDANRRGFSRLVQTDGGDLVAVGDFGVTGIPQTQVISTR